jgi:hypothetical protein
MEWPQASNINLTPEDPLRENHTKIKDIESRCPKSDYSGDKTRFEIDYRTTQPEKMAAPHKINRIIL